MARAEYIWIVQDATETIVAAFTVKHELASWLERNPRIWFVTRVRDADFGSGRPVQLNPRTLEPTG